MKIGKWIVKGAKGPFEIMQVAMFGDGGHPVHWGATIDICFSCVDKNCEIERILSVELPGASLPSLIKTGPSLIKTGDGKIFPFLIDGYELDHDKGVVEVHGEIFKDWQVFSAAMPEAASDWQEFMNLYMGDE